MGRILRYLVTLIFLAAIAGAIAVAFIDLPAPSEQITRPVEIEGLQKEIDRAQ